MKTLKEHRNIIKLLEEGRYQEAARHCAEHLKNSTMMIAKNYRNQSVFGKNIKPGKVGIVC
jgi:DNA-binding GntR family transcriptional regulator